MARWKLLADVITGASASGGYSVNSASIRSWPGLALVPVDQVNAALPGAPSKETIAQTASSHRWMSVVKPGNDPRSSPPVLVYREARAEAAVTLAALAQTESDNTGNVCIWPSEDVLAGLILSGRLGQTRPSLLNTLNLTNGAVNGAHVMEIGAGAVGLAGLLLAALTEYQPARVVVSDGNVEASQALEVNVKENESRWKDRGVVVEARHHVWGQALDAGEADGFDLVLAADCFFFEAAHDGLLATLTHYLKPGGVVWALAPTRGGSGDRFLAKVPQELWEVETVDTSYDDWVDQVGAAGPLNHPDFIRDKHWPRLTIMKKKEEVKLRTE